MTVIPFAPGGALKAISCKTGKWITHLLTDRPACWVDPLGDDRLFMSHLLQGDAILSGELCC
jgi:hypothetical protein